MNFIESIGPAIRLLRKREGVTQRQLAEAAGISKNLLSNWETGTTQPAMESLAKVFDVLGVDLLEMHNTIRLLTGRPAERVKRTSSLPAALSGEDTDQLVLLLDRAPEIALWVLQLAHTLRDPAVVEALERSMVEVAGGSDG